MSRALMFTNIADTSITGTNVVGINIVGIVGRQKCRRAHVSVGKSVIGPKCRIGTSVEKAQVSKGSNVGPPP